MKTQYLYVIGIAAFALGIVVGLGILNNIMLTKNPAVIPPGDVGVGGTACTMDARVCPDGSSVGRTGPNCEFAACSTDNGGVPVSVGGDNSCKTQSDCPLGYECVDTSPIAREGVPPNLHCFQTGTPRPMCLSGETKISTPIGEVAVKNMKKGMSVWTTDTNGKEVISTIEMVGKTRVPPDDKVIHLVLTDGRELFVSPGHKVADGRTADELKTKEGFQGAVIKVADLIPYHEQYTYDILPSGKTGIYFANGILLQSTLKK